MTKVGRSIYLFIKDQFGAGLVLVVKEDRSLQTKLWDQHYDGVLSDKQDEALLIDDPSALEEQLGGDKCNCEHSMPEWLVICREVVLRNSLESIHLSISK